jgi:transcriptional regulator with XRE-family HTH domain
MAQSNKLPVTPELGTAIREYRRSQGLTIAEFLQRIEELAAPDAPTLDDAFISRLESGKLVTVQAVKLLTIALGMGLKSVDELRQLAKGGRDVPVRIASIHALFAAPVIAAANRLTLNGATFTSFGSQRGADFVPTWSSLIADNQRRLYHTTPHPHAKEHTDPERFDNSIRAVAWEKGITRYLTGLEIDALWQKGEVDIAVVSREIFGNHLSSRASHEGIIVGTVSQSARAVNLLALVYPGRDSQSPERTQSRLKLLEYGRGLSGGDPSHGDPRPYLKACATELNNELNVLCPRGTIAHRQIDRLMAVYEWLDRGTSIRREPLSLSEYDAFRDKAFSRAQSAGVALLALWEPFATFLRQEWEALMDREAWQARSDYGGTSHSKDSHSASFEFGERFHYSVDFPLSRLFAYVGMPNPLFPMDIIATRAFLNRGPPARNVLMDLFDVLEKEIGSLHEAIDCYADNLIRSQLSSSTIVDRTSPPDSRCGNYGRSSANWLRSRANDTVLHLSSAFGLTIPDTFRALSEVEFGLTFDRSFVNYLSNVAHQQR